MHQETSAGHAISLVSGAAAYDAAVKHLLAHKPFLARIMKECLPEYRDCSIADIMNRCIEGTPSVVMIRLGDVPQLADGSIDEAALDQNVIGMPEILLKGDFSAEQRKSILENHCGIAMDFFDLPISEKETYAAILN